MVTFNPIKTDETTGEELDGIVWSKESVDIAIAAMKLSKTLVSYPFEDKKDPSYKKPFLTYEWTEEELENFTECALDVHKFASYCKVNTDDGYQPIVLRDYQIEMLDNYTDNQYNVVLASRQIGKTIVSSIYLLWYAIFHPEKTVLVVSNKWKNSKELMKKIQEIYKGLPFHLKPGVTAHNQTFISFDNKSCIEAQTATEDAGIGLTIDLLYLDEFAHIKAGLIDRVYEQLYPTVSSRRDARIIITSTPNGFNRFHNIYDDSVKGKSIYVPTRVDWYEVPYFNKKLGKYILRDEEWKAEKISMISADGFAWQFDNQFAGGGKNLLDSDQLQLLISGQEEFVCKDMPTMFNKLAKFEDFSFIDSSDLVWKPTYDIQNLKLDFLLLSIDMGEGVGLDYSAITIWKLRLPEFYNKKLEEVKKEDITLEQIGRYSSNKIPPDTFAKLLLALCEEFGMGRYRLLIERNSEGKVVLEKLKIYKNNFKTFSFNTAVIKTARGKRFEHGLTVDRNKYEFCSNTKTAIKTRRLIFTDVKVINEAKNFNKQGSTYKATVGHDDLYMTAINISSILYRPNNFWNNFVDLYTKDLLEIVDDRSLMQRAMDRNYNETRNIAGFPVNDPSNVNKRRLLTLDQERQLELSKRLSDKINKGESFAVESAMYRNSKFSFFSRLNNIK